MPAMTSTSGATGGAAILQATRTPSDADIDVTELEAPVITTTDGYRYELTGHDLLTLARSLHKEGVSDSPELLWTYAQRQALLRWGSLASLVVAHSQPINPLWFPDGPKCRPGGPYEHEQECVNAASRPANARRAWRDIDPYVRRTIIAWTRGEVPNTVPRVVDFAADSLVARKIAGANPEGFELFRNAANSFVTTTRSRAWPSDRYVRLEASGHTVSVEGWTTGTKVAFALGLAAVLGGALYLANRRGYTKKLAKKAKRTGRRAKLRLRAISYGAPII